MGKLMQEKPIQIIVNGRATMTIMTSAENTLELCLGYLFTERVIEKFSDISSIQVDGSQVSVVTTNPFGVLLSRKTVLAGCGGASSFLDSGKLERISVSLEISQEKFLESLGKLQMTKWFTGGLFTASGELLCFGSDLTCQNVVDRLIGTGLSRDVSFGECYVVVFGNVTVETVRKAIIAKIPVLAVAGEVTDSAWKIAEESGLRIEKISTESG